MPETKTNSLRYPQGLTAVVLALLIGALQTLTFSPFDAWWLGPPAMMLLCWLGWRRSARQLFLSGWLVGLGLFGSGASWVYVSIHEFGNTDVALATLLTALFVAFLALFTAVTLWAWGRLAEPGSARRLWLLPALWVVGDWLRGWVLTGFPWLYLGTSQVDGPLAGWAPILGVHGVTLIVVASATLVAGSLRAYRRRNRAAAGLMLGVLALLWVAGPLLSRIHWTRPNPEPVHFLAAQGNVPQLMKWDPKFLSNQILTYVNLTQGHWDRDLILWPETAIPLPLTNAGPVIDRIQQRLGKHSTLVTGIPWYGYSDAVQRDTFHNSIMAIGDGAGIYHKQKLVPFGEYVPLESWLRGLIAFFDLPMSDFTPGPEGQPPLKVGDDLVMPFICYEIAYPDFVAERARAYGLPDQYQ